MDMDMDQPADLVVHIPVPAIWFNRDGAGPFAWNDPLLEKPDAETIHEYRRVAYEELEGGTIVSTLFLGVDLNVLFGGVPLLFESAVFDDDHQIIAMRRYATEESALAGHEALVDKHTQPPTVQE